MIYAVIDTNVFVSFFIGKIPDTATKQVVRKMIDGTVTPMYNADIIAEYNEVLKRKKFKLNFDEVDAIIDYVETYGVPSERVPYDGYMPDEDDRVFYEISLTKEESFLVTGNLKHYPCVPKVVSPAEFMEIVEKSE